MSHPLVFALFEETATAAAGVGAARRLGVDGVQLSIVSRTHDDEVAFAKRYGASPGADLEDSRAASRLAELGASVLAALALVLPGIGPIVAAGPLGAELGEMAGHAAGDLEEVLRTSGLDGARAHEWRDRIGRGSILIGAHVLTGDAEAIRRAFEAAGASETAIGTWSNPPSSSR